MKKSHIITTLFVLISYLSLAQVKDISFTLSPAAEYTFWDKKSGLDDNFLIGGKLGFGFGEFLELRGIYMQSLNQKTSFKNYGLDFYDASLFDAQDVTIKRWGGEFKANIGTRKLKPYFTLGTGVQTIDVNGLGEFEQIYATGGLGVKFNIARRFVFALEGKNTTYRFNSGTKLLTEANKIDFGVTDADFNNKRLSNWSVQGSLQFYLGGREPGALSELDKAYLQKFRGGFKGLQFIIEPSMAYTSFNDGSLFRDTYWLGGFAGLDFNEYIGIRGFYFQATEEGKLSMDFEDLAMYGAEFRARLNDGNGVVPFIILGGGYINPSASYVTTTAVNGINIESAESGAFATGGLGLNIPLGRHLLITGGARAMLTSGDNVADISNTENIQTSIFYNAGLEFTLGKKSKSPKVVYNENLEKVKTEQQAINEEKLAGLKAEYTRKIAKLDQELKQAYNASDVDKAVEILEKKKVVEKALQDVKDVENVQKKQIEEKVIENAKKQNEIAAKQGVVGVVTDSVIAYKEGVSYDGKSGLVQMTTAEFELLVDRILKSLDEEEKAAESMPILNLNPNTIEGYQQKQMQYLNDRIKTLENLLLDLNNQKRDASTTIEAKESNDEMSKQILDRLDELNLKIDKNTNQIKGIKVEDSKVVAPPLKNEKNATVIREDNNLTETLETEDSDQENFLNYYSSSLFAGGSFGDLTTGNFGVRLHYDIKNTRFQFMPELFTGFGDKTVWGASVNLVYPFSVADGKFNPYVGIGGGIGDLGLKTKGMYNVILGTSLPLLNNNLFLDYSMRNSFDHNQIALGYKIKF